MSLQVSFAISSKRQLRSSHAWRAAHRHTQEVESVKSAHSRHRPAVQVNQLLELEDKQRGGEKYTAISRWAAQLESLQQNITNKLL